MKQLEQGNKEVYWLDKNTILDIKVLQQANYQNNTGDKTLGPGRILWIIDPSYGIWI
jgi:hypothetical protein